MAPSTTVDDLENQVRLLLRLEANQPIDKDLSFADLGFDSMLLWTLAAWVKGKLNAAVPFSEESIFQFNTVNELAAFVTTSGSGSPEPTHPVDRHRNPESLFHGFLAVPALTFFGEYGIADLWRSGEEVDLGAFSKDQGLDERIVLALASYLESYGYLENDGGRCRATAAGRTAFMRWPGAMLYYSYHPLVANVFELARKQKDYGYGKAVYRDMFLDTKASGVIGIRGTIFSNVVDYIKRAGCQCLLDLGCGDGTFLEYAANDLATLSIIGLDQSEIALEEARKRFQSAKGARKARFLQGDLLKPETFLAPLADEAVDIASIFFILHEVAREGASKVKDFLIRFGRAFGKTKLAVTEQYRLSAKELQPYLHFGYPEFLTFHDLSGQNLLRREEWLALFHDSGFKVVEILEASGAQGNLPTTGTMILEANT